MNLTFAAEIKNGKLYISRRNYFDFNIGKLRNGLAKVVVQLVKRQRTLKQNRMYWGVLNDIIFPAMAEKTGYSVNEVHAIMKERHAPKKRLLYRGIEYSIPGSTTAFTPGEFVEYFEKVKAEAADLGLVVPSPEEYYAKRFGAI